MGRDQPGQLQAIQVKTIEDLLRDDELLEICAHIGNVIRLAAIVGLEEVEAACRRSADPGLHSMLLDPARGPETPAAATQNLQLLTAFLAFRSEIAWIVKLASESGETRRQCERISDPLDDEGHDGYWNE